MIYVKSNVNQNTGNIHRKFIQLEGPKCNKIRAAIRKSKAGLIVVGDTTEQITNIWGVLEIQEQFVCEDQNKS